MSNQNKNITQAKAQGKRVSLASKTNLTKKQLTQLSVNSLNAYANTSPEEHLGKFLDL